MIILKPLLFAVLLASIYVAPTQAQQYELYTNGSLPHEPHTEAAPGKCNGVCNCTCQAPIQANHAKIRKHMSDEMIKHRTWMIDTFFKEHVLKAMTFMTNQLSAVTIRHTFTIGKFFNAKQQLETERTLQVLMAEAHKDYQPSESLCEIGSFTRSLTSSERTSDLTQLALSNRMMTRQLKQSDSLSAGGENTDARSRINFFRKNYCNENDNAKGLNNLCQNVTNKNRINSDINFNRTVLSQSTIDAELFDASSDNDTGLEDLIALDANLFATELIPDLDQLTLATQDGRPREAAYAYVQLRNIMAKRSVAQNTIAAITSERISGNNESAPFIRSLMLELGMDESEIVDVIGENPSYYAQRKALSSYAFENPTFYTELYESPTNTNRKSVALKAINLMLEDDFFDRQLESEITLAVLLELMLEDQRVLADRAIASLEPREN